LSDASEEKAAKKKAKAVAKKKTVAKKAAAKKTAASKATAEKAVTKKAPAAKKVASKATDDSAITAKKSAKSASDSAAKPKTKKKSSSKKVSAAKKKIAPSAPTAVVSDADENDSEIELPMSTQAAVVPYERDDSHYMDADQLDHFRNKLTEWKQQLMEEVDRTVGHMKDDATNFPDPNDRATQEEEFSLELRTRDRERKLIKKINEAQKRIDDDEYGYCETCGIEIGVSRLEARPTAELCIDCKTLEEIRERQTA